MELELYLEILNKCPDNKLSEELGVYDNYIILAKANFDNVFNDLISTKNYVLHKTNSVAGGKQVVVDYVPGTARLIISSWFMYGAYTSDTTEDDLKRQASQYDITISIHTYQEKKMEHTSPARALAYVIKDLSEYLIKEKIPCCFPKSRGDAHSNDRSRVAYFLPESSQ
ncbi:MAG: hypothetical protein WC916_07855 [Candidatus Woesearchaeota archaeon]